MKPGVMPSEAIVGSRPRSSLEHFVWNAGALISPGYEGDFAAKALGGIRSLDITQALAYARAMGKNISTSAAALGSRGGRAGVGASKRRGDSDFYRRLVAMRRDRKVASIGMRHRHLTHQEFTLAAIDDIISIGQRAAWERLRIALLQDAGIRDKILRVCNARANETSAQRHQFWSCYAQETRRAARTTPRILRR